MADLAFTVDFNQLKAANAELERTGKVAKTTTATYNSAFQKAIGWQVRFQNEQAKVSAKLEETYRKQTLANKSARESANVYKEAAAAAAIVAKEEERLKNKFVEGYTAMNIYTKELNDLAVARKRGLIGTKEQAAAVAQLNAQMKAGTGVFANAATGMQLVGKRANRTGMLAQQAGYQFGDFAVQVQSGTNPMVAFGQQATQLIGTFSMLAKSTKAIMAFSALGVIVPIITGIAAAFMRMKNEAKGASEETKNAATELKALVYGTSEESLKYIDKIASAKLLAVTADFNLRQRLKQAGSEAASVERRRAAEAKQAVDVAIADYTRFRDIRAGIAKIEADNEALEDRKEAVDAIVEAHSDELKFLQNKNALLAVEVQHGKDSSAYKQLVLSQARAAYREDLLKQDIRGKLLKILMDEYDVGVSLTAAAKANADALEAAKEKAKGLADALKEAASAMAGLLNTGSLEAKLAGLVAETNAIKTGADSASASLLASELSKARAQRDAALSGGNLPAKAVNQAYQDRVGIVNQVASATAARNAARDAAREKSKDGGSKKSPSEELQEYLDKLQQQSELESKLVGLFGEKRNTEEEVIKARQKYGEVFGASQEAELRGTLAQIEADKERQRVLEEAKQQQQSIADTLQSSMSDAFMSMVDGTKSFKDAMKDMARAVIKQLFEVLVVQRLVGSFDSKAGKGSGLVGMIMGAFQANGGAWQGGSQIQAYANGGVVGGPTMFPMAGGKTGLMGEAGPEAIMPLKRGANGKLGVQMEGGGGSSIVVNQSFNFSANGDDSVKKIIAQAAPQIANMTKKSIIDDRRRGGQMKATFG